LIPAKNQRAHLESCLAALRDGMDPRTPYEIIVVLNAATDEVSNFLKDQTQGIRILESPINRGVAGGYNLARTAARGDFLALIHDDTEIQPGWAERLIATLDSNERIGAVGSLILLPDGTPLSAGSVLWRKGNTCPPWAPGTPMPAGFRSLRPVDYCGTCGLMIRSPIWDAVGGLDENLYPAYYVDVDLCMAIRKQGRIVVCDGRAELKHHVGSSSNRRQRAFFALENRAYFVKKWETELEDYDLLQNVDFASLECAHRNTRARSEEIGGDGLAPSKNEPPPPPWPDNAYIEREAQVAKAYTLHLESQIANREAAEARMKRNVSELEDLAKSRNEENARLNPLAVELSSLKQRLRENPAFIARHLVRSILRKFRSS
jgi:GT2 family glycosyltransferase